MTWQEIEEGKRAGTPRINDNHKEMLSNKWDAQLREGEQVAEEAATAKNNIIDCINENFDRENLIAETTPGYLPVITQVVPKLHKGYGRGNHKPIFGLQVLAHMQSERALS